MIPVFPLKLSAQQVDVVFFDLNFTFFALQIDYARSKHKLAAPLIAQSDSKRSKMVGKFKLRFVRPPHGILRKEFVIFGPLE